MRIAYIAGQYPSVTHTFIEREVQALRALGVSIETVSVHRSHDQDTLSRTAREEAVRTQAILPPNPLGLLLAHLMAMIRVPGRYLKALRLTLALSRPGIRGHLWYLFYLSEAVLAWRHLRNRKVQHLHAHHLNQAGDVALLASILGGWTWSFTMHGPSEFYDVQYWRVAEKTTRADFVACISDFCRSQLMSLVEQEHWRKFHVVHCGVDTEDFQPQAPVGRRANALALLTVGRLERRKGQALLLDALAELRNQDVDARLTVVGDGEMRSHLEARAKGFGIADFVRFVGAIGEDDIRTFYGEADVFCLPSFAEGVPVVLMEAMAMEIPVVATNIMGIPELVDHRKNGLLVIPGRSDQLVAAIRELAADPKLRKRLGAAGRRKVAAGFHISQSARTLADAFADATGDHPVDDRLPDAPGEDDANQHRVRAGAINRS